jgi:hypothetical protein
MAFFHEIDIHFVTMLSAVFLEAKSRKGAFSEIAGANSIILLTRFRVNAIFVR